MQQEHETKAYFWVRGFEPPYSRISEVIGLEPTEAWDKGDKGKYVLCHQESHWQFCSPLPNTEIFLDSHIKVLLEILEDKIDKIQKLKDKYDVGISCVGYYQSPNPGFHLSEELINKCSILGLSLDFDLYFLNDDNEKEV
jgi:hypothetical protein